MLLNFLSSLIEKIEKRQRRTRAVRELQALSDRQLRDMGISRCDIYRVVNGDVYA